MAVVADGESRFDLRLPSAELAAWQECAEAMGVSVAVMLRTAASRFIKSLGKSDADQIARDRRDAVNWRRVVAMVRKEDQ